MELRQRLCGTPQAARWSAISDATVQGGLPGVLGAAVSPIMLKSVTNLEVLPNGWIVGTWLADDISIRDRRAATRLPWKRNEESNDI